MRLCHYYPQIMIRKLRHWEVGYLPKVQNIPLFHLTRGLLNSEDPEKLPEGTQELE